jgi:N,N'-diacetyllegionaminate synthase
MRDYFKIDVGLSDHSEGFEASLASVALGVTIIEKHFTLDNALEGPDHSSSLNPKDFKSLIEMIRNVERALGSGIKKPSESESKNIKFMRRSLVARNKIKKGEVFSIENIAAKRPADGMSPMEWEEIEGKVSDRDYAIDDLIQK